jgi:hypothetical protein
MFPVCRAPFSSLPPFFRLSHIPAQRARARARACPLSHQRPLPQCPPRPMRLSVAVSLLFAGQAFLILSLFLSPLHTKALFFTLLTWGEGAHERQRFPRRSPPPPSTCFQPLFFCRRSNPNKSRAPLLPKQHSLALRCSLLPCIPPRLFGETMGTYQLQHKAVKVERHTEIPSFL